MLTYHGGFVTKGVSRTWLAALIKQKSSVLVVAIAASKLPALMTIGILGGLKLERCAVWDLAYKHIVEEKCGYKSPDQINDSLEHLTLALALSTLVVAFGAVVWPVFVFAVPPVRRFKHGPLS